MKFLSAFRQFLIESIGTAYWFHNKQGKLHAVPSKDNHASYACRNASMFNLTLRDQNEMCHDVMNIPSHVFKHWSRVHVFGGMISIQVQELDRKCKYIAMDIAGNFKGIRGVTLADTKGSHKTYSLEELFR